MAGLTRTPPQPTPEGKLSHAGLYADRVRVYPKSVRGPARSFKWAVLVFCLSVYYLLPWVRWNRGPGQPSQAVLLDIGHERFHFFNVEFWPQDIYYLTGALILGAVSLFLVTSLVGRAWCAYACPQTVWTDLFMWIERRIEGDRNERIKRDRGRLTAGKAWRKAAKHAAWFAIAFWTGGAWIMYYADAPTVTAQFWHGTAPSEVYIFTFLFTATTYLLAGWAREQVCTFMCPWPRFQASMLDEHSLIVTYEAWRGEPRGHARRARSDDSQPGDCVDCKACVHVCPTGVDIRDGIQLECINCGLCVDACNQVMDKLGRPRGLIKWDTLAHQKSRAEGHPEGYRLLRPRTVIYVSALLIGLLAMGVAMAMRGQIDIAVEHDRAPLFVTVKDGSLRNGYTIKLSNKTHSPAAFTLGLSGLADGAMALADDSEARSTRLTLDVAPDSVGTFRVMVFGRPTGLIDGAQKLEFALRNPASGEQKSYTSIFMGPGARIR